MSIADFPVADDHLLCPTHTHVADRIATRARPLPNYHPMRTPSQPSFSHKPPRRMESRRPVMLSGLLYGRVI